MISKEEQDHNNNIAANIGKGPSSSSSSLLSSWSRSKDPRIVRVSRAFGGKDRHSKVCTVKGLRDRRVRLSVPTAIQLYDLQDRLGLNQPSKVVDWLLNVAKDEIDELPPLQMPVVGVSGGGGGGGVALIDEEGNFRSVLGGPHLGKEVESNDQSNPWISDALLRNNEKDAAEGQGLSLMNNSSSSAEQQFMTWDSSSSAAAALSLTQSRTHDHHEDHHHHQSSNFNVLPFMTSATHQVLVYQPQHHQSYFGSSSNINPTEAEGEGGGGGEDYNVPKQFNFHMLDSSPDQNNHHHQFSNPQDRRFH